MEDNRPERVGYLLTYFIKDYINTINEGSPGPSSNLERPRILLKVNGSNNGDSCWSHYF